ncbi:hypothetical protein [Cerasicoccus frondis]|uniref:hypothetical protein n=1 Tax=Cerasicoccus frondis TaxID=490090 RepID=UPI00285283A1|nr:hypothetical protein [Cerasicoccus frondis]
MRFNYIGHTLLILGGINQCIAQYSLEVESIDFGGGQASSTNYSINAEVAPTGIGISGSDSYVLGHGYWTPNPDEIILNSTYFNWVIDNGLTLGVSDSPDQNTDGDSLTQILEFAFGGDPLSTTEQLAFDELGLLSRGKPIIYYGVESSNVDFRAYFLRRADFESLGLSYTAEFSNDLQTWHASTDAVTVIDSDGEYELVMLNYPLFLSDNSLPGFFRLQIDNE